MNKLANIDIFTGLSPGELESISMASSRKHYPKNTIIISEGDHPGSLYLILEGRVKVYVSDENGKEFYLNTLEAGDYFGELSLLDAEERSASVIALEPCVCSMIQRTTFLELMQKEPSIAPKLISNLVRRIRALNDSVKSLALKDVYSRVRSLLLSMAHEADGELRIDEKLTQQDIANRVGSSREMVAKILKDLAKGEFISNNHKKITILRNLPEHY